MKRGKPSRKPYATLRDQELARSTAELDREFIADTFSVLSPEEAERWQRARRKPGRPPGRPKQGGGAKVISVSVEKELLARSDELARAMGITRARLIARGLKAVLAAEGQI